MTHLKIILLFLLLPFFTYSQSDTITSRDTAFHNYFISQLIDDYESILNSISNNNILSQNEVEELISIKADPSNQERLFLNEKVIIENDLVPESITNKSLSNDENVVTYLNEFNTNYKKTNENSVILQVNKISHLKFKTYFYYLVDFNVFYSSSDIQNKPFPKFNRLAEVVCIPNGSDWKLYISAIRFSRNNECESSLNDFMGIYSITESIDDVIKQFKEKQKWENERKNKIISSLIDEIDLILVKGNIDEAMSKAIKLKVQYFEDDKVIAYYKSVKDKFDDSYKIIEANKAKQKKIEEIIESIQFNFKTYNFDKVQSLSDSLILAYDYKSTTLSKLREKASFLISYEVLNSNMIKRNDARTSIIEIDNNINNAKAELDSVKMSWCYYLKSIALYSVSLKKNRDLIFSLLEMSINVSNFQNQHALRYRAKLYAENNQFSQSFADIHHIISNQPNDPEVYYYAAQIYLLDTVNKSTPLSSVFNYLDKSVSLRSTNINVYLLKSKVEQLLGNFNSAITTLTLAESRNLINPELYYLRGFYYYSLKEYSKAGADFKKLDPDDAHNIDYYKAIHSFSDWYKKIADEFVSEKNYIQAITNYDISIAIDSNLNSLYQKSLILYKNIKNYQESIATLLSLQKIDRTYRYSSYYIACSYQKLGDNKTALDYFNDEISNYPQEFESFYSKALCELTLYKYQQSINTFTELSKHLPSDSLYFHLALAFKSINEFGNSNSSIEKGLNINSKNANLHHLKGILLVKNLDSKTALSSLKEAYNLSLNNDSFALSYAKCLFTLEEFDQAQILFKKLMLTSYKLDSIIYYFSTSVFTVDNDDFIKDAINIFQNKKHLISDANYLKYFSVCLLYLKLNDFDNANSSLNSLKAMSNLSLDTYISVLEFIKYIYKDEINQANTIYGKAKPLPIPQNILMADSKLKKYFKSKLYKSTYVN